MSAVNIELVGSQVVYTWVDCLLVGSLKGEMKVANDRSCPASIVGGIFWLFH